jgi:DNA-binding beta-propeller fold protein YncE
VLAASCKGDDGALPEVVVGSRASATVALDPVRGRLYVAQQDLPGVSVVDVRSGALVDTFAVHAGARQLALSPDGTRLYVTDAIGNAVFAFDTATGASTIGFAGARPYGVVTDDTGTVYVTSYGENRLHAFRDAATGLELFRSWEIGQGVDQAPIDLAGPPSRGWDPRAVAYDASRGKIYVGHHSNQRVSRIDLATEQVDHAIFLERTDHPDPSVSQGVPYGIDGVAFAPGGDALWLPHVTWNEDIPMVADFAVWPAISTVTLDTFEEGPRWGIGAGLDVAREDGAPAGLATPIAAASTPDGLMLIVCEGSDELLVVDPEGGALQALRLPGAAPRGVVVAPDGARAYVHEAMSLSVAVVDISEAASGRAFVVDQLPVVADDPKVASGDRAALRWFYSARSDGSPPVSGVSERAACGTCHPDGMSKTNRWFVADASTDGTIDAQYGHPELRTGFTSTDPDEAIADLVLMFQDQGGLLGEDPLAPSADVSPTLAALERWLHGPENLPFYGSWVTTPDGGRLDPGAFEPDEACASCHPDEYASYQQAAHRHAALDEPFYLPLEARAVAEAGPGIVTWCIGCHLPEGLVTGSTLSSNGPLPVEQRGGMSCLACHAVTGNRTGEGNNPNILDPATVLAAGYPGPGDDPTAHVEAMATPDESSFCAPCHQGFVPGSGVKEFMTYQEYLDTDYHVIGHEGEATCMDCHMPRDRGYSDHSFLGPNLWFTRTYGTQADVDRAVAFMQTAATLEVAAPSSVAAGLSVPVDVTVRNSGAGHRLPTGVSNLRELWLEVTLTDADGAVVWQRGALDARGHLDPAATVFRKQLRDADGQPLHAHEVWKVAQLDDLTIEPQGSAAASYAVPTAGLDPGASATLTVRLRYRSLNQAFVDAVLGDDPPAVEVIDVATATRPLEIQ